MLKIAQKNYHAGTFDQLHVRSEVVLSWKFWFGEKSGPGDQNSRKNGQSGPFSLEKFGLNLEQWSIKTVTSWASQNLSIQQLLLALMDTVQIS